MKERNVLTASFIIASMMVMMLTGAAQAWEYYNTNPPYEWWHTEHRDNLVELFGPRLDRIQIQEYSGEQAEFNALAADQIDLTDWPLTEDLYRAWTAPGYSGNVTVSLTGPDFSMYIIDMNLDNRTLLDDGYANPAYYYHTWSSGADIPEPLGYNPMSDVWLRRAIATIIDKDMEVKTIVGGPPYLIAPLYTPLSAAYGGYVHPQITPTGALAAYTYLNSTGFGQSQVAVGNAYLDAHGYVYDAIAGHRKLNGKDFYIDFYYRADQQYGMNLATVVMGPLLTAAPPAGLGLAVNMLPVTCAGGRIEVMEQKRGHLYTGGWGLTSDPDHLWYLFGNPGYWHPGRPPNYMYYPGDGNQYTVPTNGWTLTNAQLNAWGYPSGPGSGAGVGPDLDFSDTKVWPVGSKVWMNPGNYWAWEMMTATTQARATAAALKCQEWLAFWVVGDPVYTNNGYAAFHRTYVGHDNGDAYYGQPWMGVVNAKAFGVWNTFSAYNMHPANANWGNGSATNVTMRWGFRQPTMSFNPIYAEWAWDWYVMNNCYDRMIITNPYTLGDTGNLALSWDIGTWDGSNLGLGTCTKVTFYMRHDLLWSDGMPLTSSDVYFTWGGPSVPGSLSNLLASKGLPPAYWSTNLADILSIATPDPWTVIVYLDVQAFFALHSMSGFNIVLPQHIWQPIILAGTHILDPFNMPSVCSGGWLLPSTADPGAGGTITLLRNPLHNMQSGGKPMPLTISTVQTSNASTEIGDIHWVYPELGQTAVSVDDMITIDSSYYYTVGPNQTDVYNYTLLAGLKNVTLWQWDGVGSSTDKTNYVRIATLATNRHWNAGRDGTTPVPDVETVNLGGLVVGWYFMRVAAEITGLEVYNWTAATFDTITENLNPFDGIVKTYDEYCIVTSGNQTFIVCPPPRDVGVVSVQPSQQALYAGDPLAVDVEVQNWESQHETVGVTLYADRDTAIIGDEVTVGINTVAAGPFGRSTTDFVWDTTGATGGTYTLTAVVSPLPGEINLQDNNLTASVMLFSALLPCPDINVVCPANLTVNPSIFTFDPNLHARLINIGNVSIVSTGFDGNLRVWGSRNGTVRLCVDEPDVDAYIFYLPQNGTVQVPLWLMFQPETHWETYSGTYTLDLVVCGTHRQQLTINEIDITVCQNGCYIVSNDTATFTWNLTGGSLVYLTAETDLPPGWTYNVDPPIGTYFETPHIVTVNITAPPSAEEGEIGRVTLRAYKNSTGAMIWQFIYFASTDNKPPTIESVETPTLTPDGYVLFNATASNHSGINQVMLHYSINSGPWQNTTMVWASGDTFNSTQYTCKEFVGTSSTSFQYYVSAFDWLGNETDTEAETASTLKDIAVTNVSLNRMVVFEGGNVSTSVTVANRGKLPISFFNVAFYANSTILATHPVINLENGTSTVLNFLATLPKGTYTITVVATPLPGEDTIDNNIGHATVSVSIVGDLTGAPGHSVWDFVPDRSVDGSDLIVVAMCFGSWPGAPPPYRWNANCDITNDSFIDGSDLIIIARHFGETSP